MLIPVLPLIRSGALGKWLHLSVSLCALGLHRSLTLQGRDCPSLCHTQTPGVPSNVYEVPSTRLLNSSSFAVGLDPLLSFYFGDQFWWAGPSLSRDTVSKTPKPRPCCTQFWSPASRPPGSHQRFRGLYKQETGSSKRIKIHLAQTECFCVRIRSGSLEPGRVVAADRGQQGGNQGQRLSFYRIRNV